MLGVAGGKGHSCANGHDAESMKTALAGKGLGVESADRTVREVAEASGQDAFKVIGAMAQVRK